MKRTFNLTIVAAMIITSCRSETKTASDDVDAIRNIQDQSVAAVRAKDITFIRSIYSSDAIEMPPDEPMTIGIEDIMKGWEQWFSDTTYLHNSFTEKTDNIEVSVSGDLGYVRTTSHANIKTKSGIIDEEMKNIYIYKKIEDEWKCILAIWNNNKIFDDQ
jgi:ketosteroid isomerase-like protein